MMLLSFHLLFLLQLLCRVFVSSSDSSAAVIEVCKASGCFGRHHRHQHNFVNCSTQGTRNYSPTNCRDGFPPSLDLTQYDFLYDFNSLYPYDSSHYEGLAWAGPERVQYVHHAMLHKAKRVAVLVPTTQQKWTLSITWTLRQLNIIVDEFPYNAKLRKEGETWLRNSSKWIGLTQACKTVCKPCFRAMTLAGYGVQAPHLTNITRRHCGDKHDSVFPHPRKGMVDLPFSTVESIHSDPIMHTYMRRSDSQVQRIECTHIALIVRMGNFRAFVYPEYLPDTPPGLEEKVKERYHIKDFRIIDVFKARFGADRVRVYFGNSSTQEMLDIFSNACAIVGPAGAGFANVLFSQPSAYILEVDSYIPSLTQASELVVRYESNIEAGLGTGVTWDIYKTGFDRLIPPFVFDNLTHTILTKHHNYIFIRIAYECNYLFDMQDYLNLAETTCTNVKHLSSDNMVC
jgi:hypothetical protein